MSLDALLAAVRGELGHAPEAARIVAGGPIVRFSTNGRKTDDSGWLRVFADGRGAAYGDWRRGIERTWQAAASQPLTALDRQIQAREIERCRVERAVEDRRRHDEAAVLANELWQRAVSFIAHPYADRKDIPPSGLRMLHGDGRSSRFYAPTKAEGGGVRRLSGPLIIIPMFNVAGEIRSLQAIDSGGSKSILRGSRASGLFFPIGPPPRSLRLIYSGDVNIVEGLATGAAVHQLSNSPTFVAFSAGNLKPVAHAVRSLYPRADVILCGDVDRSGAGQQAAKEAAAAVGGVISLPPFTVDELATGLTDWNDWARAHRTAPNRMVG